MSLVPLPPTLALKSSHFGLYLTYTDDSYSPAQGYVRVNGSNVFSPVAKFEVLFANVGTGVHIRCRKNRKYLRRQTASSEFITPDAAEPEEDTSNWGCTLFEPRVVEAENTTRTYLFHVPSQSYVTAWDAGGVRSLRLTNTTPHFQSIFEIIDLESVMVLPKYVAFKGRNGNYLRADSFALTTFSFTSDDKGRSDSRYEIITDGDGRMRILSLYLYQYMRAYQTISDWVYHSEYEPYAIGNYFWPTKIDSQTVALKNLYSNRFCQPYSEGEVSQRLRVHSTSLVSDAYLIVEEHVRSRRIYNTVFDLENAIIYDETPQMLATASATNNNSTTDTVQLEFTYEQSLSSTWTRNHSWMVGISATATFKVPFIGGTEVTATAEYSGFYEWGETITTTRTLTAVYTATVPPYSTVRVNLMATEGKCDVCYSYYQLDQLWDGNYETYLKDDGVCKGMNSYNFHFEASTTRNLKPGADLSDSSVEYPTTVEIIPLPELSDPTRVQHPLSTTATTTTEQDLETPVKLTEWIVPALPPETSQEGNIVEVLPSETTQDCGETVA